MPEIHPSADVKSTRVGEGTRIWQSAVVFEGSQIGSECNICAFTLIENDVRIGDRVTIKSGVYLWDGLDIEDDVFIGPCVTFTNDKWPRSGCRDFRKYRTIVKQGASIGANATILPGVTIGEKSMIGAGSVVTKDIPDYTVWVGNPARQVGRVCLCGDMWNDKHKCRLINNDVNDLRGL